MPSVHLHSIHVRNLHVHSIHVRSIHVCSMHVHSIRVHSIHVHSIHVHSIRVHSIRAHSIHAHTSRVFHRLSTWVCARVGALHGLNKQRGQAQPKLCLVLISIDYRTNPRPPSLYFPRPFLRTYTQRRVLGAHPRSTPLVVVGDFDIGGKEGRRAAGSRGQRRLRGARGLENFSRRGYIPVRAVLVGTRRPRNFGPSRARSFRLINPDTVTMGRAADTRAGSLARDCYNRGMMGPSDAREVRDQFAAIGLVGWTN